MENKPQVIITADSEAVLAKKKAWSEVGLTVHNANIQLKAKADEALALMVAPTTIDEMVAAEAVLKAVKAKLGVIEADRKAVTGQFDKVSAALMLHEKAVKDAMPAFQNAIIAIKKAHEAEQAKLRQAQEAERLAKEKAINFVNEAYSKMQALISDQCQKAFEYGLNNITEEKLAAYLKKVKAKLTLKEFTITRPDSITIENFNHALVSTDMATAEMMLEHFRVQVDEKFNFFSVALKNKEAAIQAAKEKAEREELERAERLANANVAARLETIATSEAEIVTDIKELNKKYELDMPDTESSALLIITAFVTNFAAVKDGVRVKSYLKLDVTQMGAALAWMKNKDNAFTFTGINFKVTEKL